MNTSIKLVLYALVVLAQLYVPYQMTQTQETILRMGNLYKFQTTPIDPYDPFRGRYVRLDAGMERMTHPKGTQLPLQTQEGYVVIEPDEAGFARVVDVTLTEPEDGDYIRTTVYGGQDAQVTFTYPFTRYYMEEYDAPAAERAYWQNRRENRDQTYITARVHKGEAVIEDLYVDDLPIREFLATMPEE